MNFLVPCMKTQSHYIYQELFRKQQFPNTIQLANYNCYLSQDALTQHAQGAQLSQLRCTYLLTQHVQAAELS